MRIYIILLDNFDSSSEHLSTCMFVFPGQSPLVMLIVIFFPRKKFCSPIPIGNKEVEVQANIVSAALNVIESTEPLVIRIQVTETSLPFHDFSFFIMFGDSELTFAFA